MFWLLLSHPQALHDTDPRLVCVHNALQDPQRVVDPVVRYGHKLILDLYLRGPEDDSVRVETCSLK